MTAKVLFVDDDEANLVVCAAATRDHFSVLTAPDGATALQLLKTQDVGVIIADQRMPGMTGVELLEQVSETYPDVVRLIITAYADLPAAVDAINRGKVRRYLRKPWELTELRAELHDAMGLHELRRELRVAQRRMRDSERTYTLGVIASSLVDALQNPIGWIRTHLDHARGELHGITTDLEAGSLGPAHAVLQLRELQDSLQEAAAGVQRIVDVADGIGSPSRGASRQPRRLDLAEVLRIAIQLVRSELKQCASLELDVQSGVCVMGVQTELSQLVLNLLINAMQALNAHPREHGVITVRLKQNQAEVRLEIADTGPGIPEGHLPRIFEPFFTTKENGATGLGLAISRRIAFEHGGRIEARNADSGGAVFTLWLPAVRGTPGLVDQRPGDP